MNLTELKQKPIAELLATAREMGLENVSRTRKQDIIFVLLKKHAKSGEDISGDGSGNITGWVRLSPFGRLFLSGRTR